MKRIKDCTSNELRLMIEDGYCAKKVRAELRRREEARKQDPSHGLLCYCLRCM